MSNVSIRKFLTLTPEEQYGNGSDKFGAWYDWFCTKKSLVRRGKSLVRILTKVAKSSKINRDTMYVFFKNNCPGLYDDFRICDMETGNVVYTVIPSLGEIWGRENDFATPLYQGDKKDLVAWFFA